MKTIDKIKRLRDELQEKIDNELLPSYANALAIDVVSRLDAIIEAETQPYEAGKTAEHILRHYYYYTDNSSFKHHAEESVLIAMEEYASLKVNQSKSKPDATAKEILSKHLKACYETHGEKLSDKYHGYILRAMQEYKSNESKSELPTPTEKRDQFGVIAECAVNECHCLLCVYVNLEGTSDECTHCNKFNSINEYYISK